jgi:hypothetical protein
VSSTPPLVTQPTSDSSQLKAQITHRTSVLGRALHASADGVLYRSEGFRTYRSTDCGESWVQFLTTPGGVRNSFTKHSRIATRFFRQEVRALLPLESGSHVAATRGGIYHSAKGVMNMRPAEVEEGHRKVQPPTSLCAGPDGRVVWGEYWRNLNRKFMRLYGSLDNGKSYAEIHRFTGGEIRHVHGLLYDDSLNKYWVFVGDHDSEPGIGLLDGDWSHFEWVHKGEQRHRLVTAFDRGDHLLYATDTEKEGNAIYRLHKGSGALERVAEIDGSCIYGCRIGDGFLFSTSAEPRHDNSPQVASLWHSTDGDSWELIYSVPKDGWQANLFQFGSLVLPRGTLPNGRVMFSGQAVEGIDGQVVLGQLEQKT